MVVNVSSKSSDWRARDLSNFARIPFIFDGEPFESVEGFIQGIKFPEGLVNRLLGTVCTGIQAKKLGQSADGKYVWWQGRQIVFGSEEHHRLIARAIMAKFDQSSRAMNALLATEGEEITHDFGLSEDTDTSLPAELFCKVLTEIRKMKTGE